MPPKIHSIDCTGHDRLGNGVRRRMDGGGDGFGGAHRLLGRGVHMHDIDAVFGMEIFGTNTEDRLFVEYEPDAYDNRMEVIRRFAVIALFDRKDSVDKALSGRNALSTAFYLHLCRVIGEKQPKIPRFFYCCGPKEGPWNLVEIYPLTGEMIGDVSSDITANNISSVWRSIGLISLRNELRSWIVNLPDGEGDVREGAA